MTYEELRLAFPSLLDEAKISLLRSYCDILLVENQKYNLTAIKTEEEVIEKHFYDCLLPTMDSYFVGEEILDVGSGAGFPGMVWAIAFPDRHFTLLDATAKRCRFLEMVAQELHLENVTVVLARAEEYEARERFDLVTARAVSRLPILLEITAPFAKVGGLVLAMKGSQGKEELMEAKHALSVLSLHHLVTASSSLPQGDERLNIFLSKEKKSDAKYPRPWAKIMAKPL